MFFFKYIHGIKKKMGKKKRKRFKIAISYAKEKQDLEKIKRSHLSPNYSYPNNKASIYKCMKLSYNFNVSANFLQYFVCLRVLINLKRKEKILHEDIEKTKSLITNQFRCIQESQDTRKELVDDLLSVARFSKGFNS